MYSICIIVPVYRGEQYINRLIQMFDEGAQTMQFVYPDVSVHLSFVNDSPEIELLSTSHICSNHLTCSFLNPGIHQGIHAARIYGLRHTNSNFVLFFDQDDLVENRYLLSQYEKTNSNETDFDGVVCNGIYRGNRLIYSNRRPMQMTFDRKALLEKNWNPISPGQVLIRRQSIPVEQWSRYVLKHNLADDWLLWFLMSNNGCYFNLNAEVLYTHSENGTNSSQNWKEMGQSRVELLEILRKLGVLSHDEETAFQKKTEQYLAKYKHYIMLDDLLNNTDRTLLVRSIHNKIAGHRVAIYGMGVYGQMLLKLLLDAGITVSYGIDQQAGAMKESVIPIYGVDEKQFPETDMIIVTPIFAFDEIVGATLKDMLCPIVRMDEFIMDCLETSFGE